MPAGMLGETKNTGEIDVDDRFPVFFGMFCGGRAANNACIIDQDVDGSEMLNRFVDEARADGCIADIASESNGIDAERNQLLLCGCRSRVGSMHGDIGASLGQGNGDSRT